VNRIITRGMGPRHLLVTRGYGISSAVQKFREILNLVSKIGTSLSLVSKWKKTDCA